MDTFLKILTLRKNIVFKGNYIKLKSLLDNYDKQFYLAWDARNELTITSKLSVGTLSWPFGGIYGYILIENTNKTPLQLKFRTKIRLEMIFIIFATLCMLVAASQSTEKIPLWSYLALTLIPFCFGLVYRIQEKMLFSKFKILIESI